MTPLRLLRNAIVPALGELALAGIPDTPDARRLLLAIAIQESGLRHRRQVVTGGAEAGPAISFWQFEAGGGCRGVLEHHIVAPCMHGLCAEFNVPVTPQALWEAMRYQDVLAASRAPADLHPARQAAAHARGRVDTVPRRLTPGQATPRDLGRSLGHRNHLREGARMKKLIALALLATLVGCAKLTVKATFEYPAKAAVAK